MRYDYSCPSCGWAGTLVVNHLKDRDEQKCQQIVQTRAQDDQILAENECGAALQRAELSGKPANMGFNWGAWNGSSGGKG